jgi:serine/threonine protein phosphatase PrpC
MASDQRPKIKLRSAMRTDVGVVRDHNEDAAYVDGDQCFFVVADGMGGHAAGEVASDMAVQTVRNALTEAADQLSSFAQDPSDEGRKDAVNVLESAVRAAHQAVYERGVQETDKQGMGTTLDVVLVAGPEAFIAHVGDSRTYLVRDGKAAQITTDHTVAEVLVIEGKLSLEEAQISPLRTILVNAIGVAPDVGVEMAHVQLRKDDRLLLCSDGLHDYFPVEQEIADSILGSDPESALSRLIDLAKERGGHDNITGVIVEVLDCEPLPADAIGFGEPAGALDQSDGVPATIERDDTMPVDVEEIPPRKKKTSPEATRTTDPVLEPVDPFGVTLDAPEGKPPPEEATAAADEAKKADDDDGKSDDDGEKKAEAQQEKSAEKGDGEKSDDDAKG